jgi:hypothetical protein
VQCLARKDGTDDFYTLKILSMEDPSHESQDHRQGKMLMHTEYSLLSLLHDQQGVVHHHGLFKVWFAPQLTYRNIPLRICYISEVDRIIAPGTSTIDCH